MNDEIKKKIEEILYKADAFNFAETSEKLITLYTEMVEGELKTYTEWAKDKRLSAYDTDILVKQYLLERKV